MLPRCAELWTVNRNKYSGKNLSNVGKENLGEKMQGPRYGNGNRGIRMCQEICDKFKYLVILRVFFKVRELELIGHFVRVDGKRRGKKLLEGKRGGGRRKGRPVKSEWFWTEQAGHQSRGKPWL